MEIKINSKLLHRGKHFSFLQDEVELPDGKRTKRDIVAHPGAVAIVPVMDDGRIVLVRQYRYAAGRELLEIPAGTLEVGEPVDDCAYRELREETGYSASSIKKVISCYMAPGYSSEVIHYYVARGLTPVGSELDPDEFIEVETYSLKDILSMIKDNTIIDAKTVTGILTTFRLS